MINIYFQTVLVTTLILFVNFSQQKHLPPFIERCKFTTDGKVLGGCVKNVFNENKNKFMDGVPEMKIPALDPFVVDRIDISNGDGSAVSLNAVFKNIKVEGSRNIIVERLEPDIPNAKAVLELRFPTFHISADYDLNGKIMILPINGSGQCNAEFTNIHSITNFYGKFVTRHNKEYLEWIDQKLDLTIGGASFYFENLIRGNKELTESTNKMLNDNSADILKEFQPLVEETIATITFSILQRVFHTYSIDELFEK